MLKSKYQPIILILLIIILISLIIPTKVFGGPIDTETEKLEKEVNEMLLKINELNQQKEVLQGNSIEGDSDEALDYTIKELEENIKVITQSISNVEEEMISVKMDREIAFRAKVLSLQKVVKVIVFILFFILIVAALVSTIKFGFYSIFATAALIICLLMVNSLITTEILKNSEPVDRNEIISSLERMPTRHKMIKMTNDNINISNKAMAIENHKEKQIFLLKEEMKKLESEYLSIFTLYEKYYKQ